jgi:hypothetical protein
VIIDTSVSGPPVPELEQDEWSLQSISLPLDGLIGHLTSKTCFFKKKKKEKKEPFPQEYIILNLLLYRLRKAT